MNIKSTLLLAAAATFVLAACAPKPENVRAGYTPQAPYDNLSCDQIAKEAVTASNKAHDAVGAERRHRKQDQALVATGLVVFWPALFFTHGKSASSAADLGQLKGEIQALEAASAEKNCGITFNRV